MPMGHIAHMENKSLLMSNWAIIIPKIWLNPSLTRETVPINNTSMQTSHYTITMIKRKKSKILRKQWPLISKNISPLHTGMLVQSEVLECFCYFTLISPWKRVTPSSKQPWIPFTQECFNCAKVFWVFFKISK